MGYFWIISVLSYYVTVRSSASDVASLGAAMVAGQAKGISLWDLNQEQESINNIGDTYLPCTSHEGMKYEWRKYLMEIIFIKFS